MPSFIQTLGQVTAIIGTQWGDEGKGKLVDILSEEYSIIVRANGGANAGHTIYLPDPANSDKPKKFVFHLIPSGILHEHKICIIGNGCVVHLPTLFDELEELARNEISVTGRFFISNRCHLTFDYHKIVDGLNEEAKGDKKVGTTNRGIGPTYTDKASRHGIRLHQLVGDFQAFSDHFRAQVARLQKIFTFEYDIEGEIKLYRELAEKIHPYVIDSASYLNHALTENKTLLLEGGQGTMLDIDHGTYPFVTSSNASIGGLITGSGIPPLKIKSVIGILKAYVTRVGAGPFPSELDNEIGEQLRQKGGEFGATTQRPRRCGWFDAVVGRYAVMINGLSHINLTKLDVLSELPTIKIAIGYKVDGKPLESLPASSETLEKVEVEYLELPGWREDLSNCQTFENLPENAQKYVLKIEELINCPIHSIGVGPLRSQMIIK